METTRESDRSAGAVRRTELSRWVRAAALDAGFDAVGLAPVRPSDHAALYRAWIHRGLHGSMDYLARPDAVEARLDPRRRWPEVRSAVVVADHYGTGTDEEATGPGSGTGIIARYARGRDYHRVVKKKLMRLLRRIEDEVGQELPTARAYVDTGPVLERELAQRAGLGWHGRNTMLIDPRRGSYFFLGVLFLPFELEYDEPFTADRCGTCTACLPACPTGALLGRDESGAPVMDATRCISYLTIENRGAIPEELRPAMGNRVYGCDICQEVCPWNNPRLVPITSEEDYRPRPPAEVRGRSPSALRAPASPRGGRSRSRPREPGGADSSRGVAPSSGARGSTRLPGTESPSLVELLRMSEEEWDLWTRGSAIRRAGYAGLKRNVAVAMGNWLASVEETPAEAVAALRAALEDEDPLVREHAAWALRRAREERPTAGGARRI